MKIFVLFAFALREMYRGEKDKKFRHHSRDTLRTRCGNLLSYNVSLCL